MEKVYLVSTYTDNGKISAWILTESEFNNNAEYRAVLEYGGFVERDRYDLYVEEFSDISKAIDAKEELLNITS